MAIEIEKKYRLDQTRTDEVAAKLEKMGAVFSSEVFEENYLHRGGLLDERSAVLRLRKIGDVTLLTYKEKFRNDSDIKHKIEFETVVADVDAMESIIEKLGYRLSVVYEKHRKTWHFREVEVVLDELPFGLYMEIEGTIEHIAEAEKLLNIRDLTPELRGYPRLTLKYGKMIGDVAEARFKRRAAV
ncbi:MAG: class IV adenylate cyclase [Pyrinomonadaceae bacterium]|nr:class IV adenylate cyclase [Acidobacteriota bacterium]